MQKSLIYIDVNSKSQVLPSGTFVKNVSDMLTIERGQWQILCVQFVTRQEDEYGTLTLTNKDMSAAASYILTADNDFADDNSLMLKSYQSAIPFDEKEPTSNRINIEGDWIDGTTADLSKGQMSIRINADTAKFAEILGAAKTKSNMYINIKQYIAGISNPSTVAWFTFVAQNTVRDWGEPEELVPEGSTIVPFINAFFSKPLDMQFSVDGTEWHEEQTVDDLYFRMKFKSVDTQWSEPIRLAEGVDGTDGNDGKDGKDGITPHIGNNGNWFIGTTDTGVSASGNGADAEIVDKGNYFDGVTVEEALQELGADLDGIDKLLAEI